jgi:hypothetical protein
MVSMLLSTCAMGGDVVLVMFHVFMSCHMYYRSQHVLQCCGTHSCCWAAPVAP